jgi:S1-C subfamily serine protease
MLWNSIVMDILDLIIVILVVAAFFRGREIGSIRQVFSTVGFFGGLILGAFIGPKFVHFAHTQLSRSLLTLSITLGIALIGLTLAEYLGELVKRRVQFRKIDLIDQALGSIVGVVTLLATVWLGAAILLKLPYVGLQNDLKNSAIISYMDESLPQAPNVVTDLGHVINPNGFPEVFINGEPTPGNATLPSLGSLQAAVTKDQASVVKIEGTGCGGIVEGSGFVAANNLVLTNAHVVAGIAKPYVIDKYGQFAATPIWFDPNLDLAVLNVNNLGLPSLNINSALADNGTAAAVLGYPGGGPFQAVPASVVDEFTAVGRNIYNQNNTERNVYEIKATVIPGNSGGPLVNTHGSVIGIIFAQSTVYNQVGYALTTQMPLQELHQAEASPQAVATGSCAE